MVAKHIKRNTFHPKNLKKIPRVLAGYAGGRGQRSDGSGLTNAQLAHLLTEGTGSDLAQLVYSISTGDQLAGILPRPFIEPAIEQANEVIVKELIHAIQDYLMHHNRVIFNRVGIAGVNAIQKFIRDYPENELMPNKPKTIKDKGFDHPLIGKTGQLIGSVEFIVEDR